jgi:lipopolysaccharide transport protein LptA
MRAQILKFTLLALLFPAMVANAQNQNESAQAEQAQPAVQIHSDQQDFFRDGRVIYKGNVELIYGINTLKADEINIRTEKGQEWFVATGNPTTFTSVTPENEEKSLYAQAQTIEFSVQSDTVVLTQAVLTQGRHKIEGQSIEYNLNTGQFSASNAKTTRYAAEPNTDK